MTSALGADYKLAVVESVKRKFGEAGFVVKTIDLSKQAKDISIRQLNEFAPDIVVSSHVVGKNLVYGFDGEIAKPYRDYYIIADYEVPFILKSMRSEESFIVVPNEEFKQELESIGYKPNQLLPFGIPVSEKFHKQLDINKTLARLKLPGFDKSVPTVLVAAGAPGFVSVIKRLAFNPEIQIIAVCGGSAKLKQRISRIAGNARIYSFGLCDNIDELMTVSHFYIGRADGLSVTEAVAKGLHLVTFKKLPLQEAANFHYLESKGLAKSIKKMMQLEYYVALKPDKQNKSDVLVEYSAEKIVNHALKGSSSTKSKAR